MHVPVLLLHGLWMRSAALGLLARRLSAAGFAVSTLDYPSVHGGPEAALPLLIDTLRALGPGPVRIVAHSPGGLMALSALQAAPELRRDRALGRAAGRAKGCHYVSISVVDSAPT